MKRTFVILVATLVAALTWADGPSEPKLSVEGVRLVGGDLGLSLSGWKLVAGGGYEMPDFGRDRTTGDPLSASDQRAAKAPTFLNGDLKLYYTWDLGVADFWVGSGVWGYNNLGTGSPSSGMFPDFDGNTFAFGQIGLTRDHRVANDHGVLTGTKAEAFAEWGPSALSVRSTDYLKLSFQGSHLLPLWDFDGPGHVFSGTLANRLYAAWIDGSRVPVPLLEPTEVRGYYRLLDTKFRSVATSELRVGLPSLWGPHDLVPVIFAFAEGGWYSGYSDTVTTHSGWLASTGAGLGLSVWGLTTLTVTAAVPLSDGESGLWWKINFNLRF